MTANKAEPARLFSKVIWNNSGLMKRMARDPSMQNTARTMMNSKIPNGLFMMGRLTLKVSGSENGDDFCATMARERQHKKRRSFRSPLDRLVMRR